MAVHFTGPILYKGVGGNAVSPSGNGWPDNMPTSVNPDYLVRMDDFNQVAINTTNDWTVVKDAGAAVALVADKESGWVTITSAGTTDNDGGAMHGNEIFLPAAGRDIWFEAKFKDSHAAQNDVFVGLTQRFTTDPEAILLASNRIGFQINDESAAILCKSEVADTETSTDSGVSLVDDTFITVGFHVIGTTAIEFYVERKLVAVHSSVPTTELALGLFSLSGNATGTHVFTCDYVMGVATR